MSIFVIASILCYLTTGVLQADIRGVLLPTGTFSGPVDPASDTDISVTWQPAKTPKVILEVRCDAGISTSTTLHYDETVQNVFVLNAASSYDFAAFMASVKLMNCDHKPTDGDLDRLIYNDNWDMMMVRYSAQDVWLWRS